MTKRISGARYGGLENAVVYDLCHKLLAVVDALPLSADYEQRREAAQVAFQATHRLAEAHPHTPLSDALYALAGALQMYVIHRASVASEARRVRDALYQTMW